VGKIIYHNLEVAELNWNFHMSHSSETSHPSHVILPDPFKKFDSSCRRIGQSVPSSTSSFSSTGFHIFQCDENFYDFESCELVSCRVFRFGSASLWNAICYGGVLIPVSLLSVSPESVLCSQSVVIPRTTERIKTRGGSYFENWRSLESVAFESNSKLAEIGPNAISYCLSLRSICIPASVTLLGMHCFSECPSLSSLTFDPLRGSTESRDSHLRDVRYYSPFVFQRLLKRSPFHFVSSGIQ
jgi:hypothetical protein